MQNPRKNIGNQIKNPSDYIGKRVAKTAMSKKSTPKPFKSGNKVNTVKGVINHPILNVDAFTFEEDDSYVECRRCALIPYSEDIDNLIGGGPDTKITGETIFKDKNNTARPIRGQKQAAA